MLKFIRNVRWVYGDVVPDYILGQTTCALYLRFAFITCQHMPDHRGLRIMSFVIPLLVSTDLPILWNGDIYSRVSANDGDSLLCEQLTVSSASSRLPVLPNPRAAEELPAKGGALPRRCGESYSAHLEVRKILPKTFEWLVKGRVYCR